MDGQQEAEWSGQALSWWEKVHKEWPGSEERADGARPQVALGNGCWARWGRRRWRLPPLTWPLAGGVCSASLAWVRWQQPGSLGPSSCPPWLFAEAGALQLPLGVPADAWGLKELESSGLVWVAASGPAPAQTLTLGSPRGQEHQWGPLFRPCQELRLQGHTLLCPGLLLVLAAQAQVGCRGGLLRVAVPRSLSLQLMQHRALWPLGSPASLEGPLWLSCNSWDSGEQARALFLSHSGDPEQGPESGGGADAKPSCCLGLEFLPAVPAPLHCSPVPRTLAEGKNALVHCA